MATTRCSTAAVVVIAAPSSASPATSPPSSSHPPALSAATAELRRLALPQTQGRFLAALQLFARGQGGLVPLAAALSLAALFSRGNVIAFVRRLLRAAPDMVTLSSAPAALVLTEVAASTPEDVAEIVAALAAPHAPPRRARGPSAPAPDPRQLSLLADPDRAADSAPASGVQRRVQAARLARSDAARRAANARWERYRARAAGTLPHVPVPPPAGYAEAHAPHADRMRTDAQLLEMLRHFASAHTTTETHAPHADRMRTDAQAPVVSGSYASASACAHPACAACGRTAAGIPPENGAHPPQNCPGTEPATRAQASSRGSSLSDQVNPRPSRPPVWILPPTPQDPTREATVDETGRTGASPAVDNPEQTAARPRRRFRRHALRLEPSAPPPVGPSVLPPSSPEAASEPPEPPRSSAAPVACPADLTLTPSMRRRLLAAGFAESRLVELERRFVAQFEDAEPCPAEAWPRRLFGWVRKLGAVPGARELQLAREAAEARARVEAEQRAAAATAAAAAAVAPPPRARTWQEVHDAHAAALAHAERSYAEVLADPRQAWAAAPMKVAVDDARARLDAFLAKHPRPGLASTQPAPQERAATG